MIDNEIIIKQIDMNFINLAPVLNMEINRCFDTYIESSSDSDNEQIEMKDCQFAEILFFSQNKLGIYGTTKHVIFIGEYLSKWNSTKNITTLKRRNSYIRKRKKKKKIR